MRTEGGEYLGRKKIKRNIKEETGREEKKRKRRYRKDETEKKD
jgi:hypothetical protein